LCVRTPASLRSTRQSAGVRSSSFDAIDLGCNLRDLPQPAGPSEFHQ
jgi:hypothetical protein